MKVSTPVKIGALLVAGGAVYFAASAYKMANNIVVDVGAKLDDFGILKGAFLTLKVTLKNPTAGTARIKFPFITLMAGDSTVATSTLRGDEPDVKIAQYGSTSFNIPIHIPSSAILPLATQFGQLLLGRIDQVDIKVKTQTTAFVPLIPLGFPVLEETVVPVRLRSQQQVVNGGRALLTWEPETNPTWSAESSAQRLMSIAQAYNYNGE